MYLFPCLCLLTPNNFVGGPSLGLNYAPYNVSFSDYFMIVLQDLQGNSVLFPKFGPLQGNSVCSILTYFSKFVSLTHYNEPTSPSIWKFASLVSVPCNGPTKVTRLYPSRTWSGPSFLRVQTLCPNFFFISGKSPSNLILYSLCLRVYENFTHPVQWLRDLSRHRNHRYFSSKIPFYYLNITQLTTRGFSSRFRIKGLGYFEWNRPFFPETSILILRTLLSIRT